MKTQVVISFDEMKPHWAERCGLDKEAAGLGMSYITVTGDFDAKITHIYGFVEDFGAFAKAMESSPSLREGSLALVEIRGDLRQRPPKKKYSFELNTLYGEQVEGHEERGFHSYDTFVTEGNNLEELCDNGSVFTVDQDGGEGWEVMFWDLPVRHQAALREAMMKKIDLNAFKKAESM